MKSVFMCSLQKHKTEQKIYTVLISEDFYWHSLYAIHMQWWSTGIME